MDLRFSEQDEQFRSELRSWLDAHLPASMRSPAFWADKSADESFAIRREWEASKAAAGFAGIQWPVEYGGRGGGPTMKAIYDEEMAKANAPSTVNPLGLAFLAPTVMAVGTEEQKREIIKPLLHCETIWCQGFSEPGAGSDLAALQMRAEPSGEEYVLNGQKIWTTNAMHGDKIFTLARTSSPEGGKKHAGISMLLVDMHQPGVEARPLKQMTGQSEFGEVFFTDATVPKTEVLGGEGNGWATAMLLLSFERGSSAIGQYTEFRKMWEEVVQVAAAVDRDGRPASEDPVLRQELAAALVELECLKYHSWHVLTQTSHGKDLGFEASMTKIMWSETFRRVSDAYERVLGTGFSVPDPRPGLSLAELTSLAMWSRSCTIWGGSQQVQRTVVAERVLGLPR
ncbi:MAG: Acyl-CoA dehydrogenase, long-chain specific [uncultured Frankineae bacterium]|uniref:Acyl-CoA dehydrogenase, long-chain specific n=1 Tax=uncultured Frankineae bacterium TaxID=437475 RepID=A0A6J4MCD8_9ACTN|nr:MAG: Acyl-CoA dehydrogenase, long-chain specific [uncultured Frankineae bacterium]